MKEIGHITETDATVDRGISMIVIYSMIQMIYIAEVDPIVGINCNITTMNVTIGKKIIDHRITMKGTGPIVEKDPMTETGHTEETGPKVVIVHMIEMIHIVETDCKTITEIIKETGHIAETGHTVQMGHTVEIGHKATAKMTMERTTTRRTIEMIIEKKVTKTRDIGEKIIMKTHMKRTTIELAI